MQYIMSLDQGTTSSRCIIFDKQGAICALAQKEFKQYYPKPGWVEHDAEEIWTTILEVSHQALDKLGVDADHIAAIGITNQRETTIIWDRTTGRPIYNAIVWQCRRTSDMVDGLIAAGCSDRIWQKTGLIPDAYFSGTKIKWILDHVPEAREKAERGQLLFGTIDTWLIWNLTGGRVHVTDYTNASRTMLFNIHSLCWDEELLDMLDIPRNILPKVRPSSCIYGMTQLKLYGKEIPISGAVGDQQGALFGQCGFQPGSLKNTYGTGCFLLMNTGSEIVRSTNGLLTTIAVGLEDHVEYALEGSIFIAGAAIQWLRDELKVISCAAESQYYAEQVEDTEGAYLVPAFTGLGAPYWDQYARGVLVGLTRGFSKAHLIRATLESLAYQTYDICKAMEKDSQISITRLNVDGGASANDFLLQFQSDILGIDVYRPECIETTALGAAYLAGLAVGFWKDRQEISSSGKEGRLFISNMAEEKRMKYIEGWHKAVRCAMHWAE